MQEPRTGNPNAENNLLWKIWPWQTRFDYPGHCCTERTWLNLQLLERNSASFLDTLRGNKSVEVNLGGKTVVKRFTLISAELGQ